MKNGILIGIAVLFCSFYCIADSVDDALNGFSQALQQSMNDLDAFSKGRCNQCKGSGTCSYCDGSGYLNFAKCWSCHGTGECSNCGGDGNWLNQI